jgi:TetR/AcrR family transcriptional regulator, regulator of cefoperazone and chloramphenicol sensitivity
LAAASAVFAESGFRRATVRDICQRAGANIAAVNYHFRDKEGLYLEVLRHARTRADEAHPVCGPGRTAVPAEQRLEQFVRSFLDRLLGPGPAALSGRLMAREMVEPSAVLDTVVREQVQPIADEIRAIVSAILGRSAPEALIRMCGVSVVSQCFFYQQCREVMQRLFPDMTYEAADLERLAAHITRFSLVGLKAIAQGLRRG